MGDLNGLKLINDTFGHEMGDKMLRLAAATMQSMCRIDDVVARWGGDEFIILLPNTKKEEAADIAKRIKDLYAQKQVKGIEGSISFGWDTKENPAEDIMKVSKNAEDYMYRNKTLEQEIVRSNMINGIIASLYARHPREERHSRRVSELCQEIGIAMGLLDIEIHKLEVAGLLHDIGKIAIEEEILNKQGELTAEEWAEIKRHPEIGFRILSSSHEMLEITECILSHHERWDGTGYPKGLKGEEIPKLSRIITFADSYDAMTSESPYRKALSEEAVLREICEHAGTQFDPEIVAIFIEKVLGKSWQQ